MKAFQTVICLFLLLETTYSLTYSEDEAYAEVKWAGAAYCCGTIGKGCSDWSCPSCKGNMETIVVSNEETFANGFVGYDSDVNKIVLSFAGTNPIRIKNWIDDLDFFKTKFTGYGNVIINCTDCEVHEGFYRTYMSVADQVRSAVNQFMNDHPDAPIVVTGHSLGAAIAQHAAMDMTIMGYNVESLYNFGQPRTGEEKFSSYSFDILKDKIFRITHHKDPVPHLPLENVMNFYHEPREIFYGEFNNKYTICDSSGEDPTCSDKYELDLNLIDHLTYMGFDFIANSVVCMF
jgi:hypothetical protein